MEQILSEEYGIEKEKIELSKQSKLMHKMANINKGKVIEQDNDEQNEEESPEAQIETKEQHIADKKYKIKISVDDLKNMPCILITSKEQQKSEREFYQQVLGFGGNFIYAQTLDEGQLMVAGNRGFMPVERIGTF